MKNTQNFHFRICMLMTVGVNLLINGCGIIAQDQYSYPVKLSHGNRFLTDQSDIPFFWTGEAAWSLIAQLNKDDVEYYLDDRQKKGFTVLLVNLIEHKFCDNAPANYYNEKPFLGRTFTTPNEQYFRHADYVINAASKRGILILLCPLYLGWDFGDEGWGAEVIDASKSDLRNWGRFVGQRYKNADNILWCIGGDTDPSQQKDKILEFVKGIRETDNRHLFTTHNHPEFLTTEPWENQDWLTINNIYSYSKTLYELCKKAYDHKPKMPYFMMESAYENEHKSTTQRLRSEAYWPILCGAMGHIFGNCPIWHFSSSTKFCELVDWKTQLNLPGSENMMYLQRLLRSRPWHLLIPDFEHNVMTNGYGQWGADVYSTAALAADSTTMLAYLPGKLPVTVNMKTISGKNARCWWFDPRNGKVTEIGTFKTKGTQTFTKPSEDDWILVIDDASLNYSPPGIKRLF